MVKEIKYTLIRNILLKWYDDNKREYPWRKSNDLYKILVTEILLQKTIALNVSNMYNSFFKKYKDFSSIYSANISELQPTIKVLGLSNKRAQILKDLSQIIVTEHNGEIPRDTDKLKEVNGIADYVSNAFGCFGLNKRTLFFDVNIKRVIMRVFEPQGSKFTSDSMYSHLDNLLPVMEVKYMYWAILDFGAIICSKNKPKCTLCPIAQHCLYFLNPT
jgi:A/G-specific adenine glycosylase